VTDLGIAFDGRNPLGAMVEQARIAEAAGAGSVWMSSHLFCRDPFSAAATILAATRTARVTLMAVSPHAMHPVHIAMAAATLDEAAPGRVALCLGTGAPGDLAGAGIEPRRRLATLREAVDVIRRLLTGARVERRGDVFRVNGRLHGGPHAVPVLLAASGPRVLELAGAVADGVILSAGSSLPFVTWALEQAEREARGRPFRRAVQVYVKAGDDVRGAVDRFRRQLAVTLRGEHHRRNVALAGSGLDQDALGALVAREEWSALPALLTDEVVRRHAAVGAPADVRERLAAYRKAGIDEIVLGGLYDPGETRETIRAAAS
jgi:5,10-methylenetetrahydromethanopterin reductase